MNNVLNRLLDRWNATDRSRKILINTGLFLLAVLSFLTSNPLFELGPQGLQWAAVLAFFGNALAGIATVPFRQIPVGYKLIQPDPSTGGLYRLEKDTSTNWLAMILQTLRVTDSLVSILVNLGLFIGIFLMVLTDNSILSGDLPKFITAIAFLGNALADMRHVPDQVVPEGYILVQNQETGEFSIMLEPVSEPVEPTPQARFAGPKADPLEGLVVVQF